MIVLVIIGVGIWVLTSGDDDGSSDSSKTSAGSAGNPTQASKDFYNAWQSQDRAAAGKVATPEAVTAIFAYPVAEGTGLVFGGCQKVPAGASAQICTFSRPGGLLTMTASGSGSEWKINAVTLGPAATTPTS